MNPIEHLISRSAAIEAKIGYTFQDKQLLATAFIHCSFLNENREISEQHNERMEFLGDSVLGLIVADYLYRHFPSIPEGDLSTMRSGVVEASTCVALIQRLHLEEFLLLGKGERLNDGRGRESILSDLFEAIIGAIYLDGGLAAATRFLFDNFSHEIEEILKTPLRNWKALLQDLCQKKYQKAPTYQLISETGPDHSKQFCVAVSINDQLLGNGEGSSKKEAQQAAAADALAHLKNGESPHG